jgi:small subunit ribosomal protein S16
MPVKIRLARHGRKAAAYYHIVVADIRSPRDGKYIERIGDYNPNTNPATVNLDFDKALDWLMKGAQPTDTMRSILSYEGVLYKKHLLGGVKKGAFDEATAESKFQEWKAQKIAKIGAEANKIAKESEEDKQSRLEAEKKINDARAEAIVKRNSDLAAEAEAATKAEEVTAEAVVEEPKAEAVVEEPKAEAVVEKATEEKAEEPKAKTVVEEATKEKVEEPKAEEKKEKKAE